MSAHLSVPTCNRSDKEVFQTDEERKTHFFMQYSFSISHMVSRSFGLTLSALVHLSVYVIIVSVYIIIGDLKI